MTDPITKYDLETTSRTTLAAWLLDDAEEGALREWAWEWLMHAYNGEELRRMVRDAMPEGADDAA